MKRRKFIGTSIAAVAVTALNLKPTALATVPTNSDSVTLADPERKLYTFGEQTIEYTSGSAIFLAYQNDMQVREALIREHIQNNRIIRYAPDEDCIYQINRINKESK